MLFHLNLTTMTIISVLIQFCLTIILGIHKTTCLTNLFSGRSYYVETSHLITGAYRLTGFFAVGMSTDGFSTRLYDIIFC